MKIRNRIVEQRRVRLGDIRVNPSNYKLHTPQQRGALEAVVGEVGWLGVPLVYRSERTGELTFVDGNLRGSEYPDLEVVVAVTDLTDEEADYALLTYDPLAAMSGIVADQLDALLRGVHTDSDIVRAMLDEQAASIAPPEFDEPDEVQDDPLPDDTPPVAQGQYVIRIVVSNAEHLPAVEAAVRELLMRAKVEGWDIKADME